MKKYKLSNDFLISATLLFISFFIVQGVALPSMYANNQTAIVIKSFTSPYNSNIYNIKPSKETVGAYTFNYNYAKVSSNQKDTAFDAPIIPFDQKKAGVSSGFEVGVRDAWNYPVQENIYMSLKEEPKAQELPSKEKKETPSVSGTKNLDADTNNLGVYNCRADTSVTGYFKAYFEDVALSTGVGYADPVYGPNRRAEACQVLQDISELIKLNTLTVTPDIIFMANQNIPPGALAAASTYFQPKNPIIANDGMLHDYILSGQDPSPTLGQFDALVITNFSGVAWDVDSTLNGNTYNFYSVIYHEMMHALGFRGLLPAVISQTNIPQIHTTFDTFTYKDNTLNNPFINATTSNLEVATGAPSPWFTTNNVVYRGVKNIVNATPDNTDPIYSPSSWQQGSSLSHFDMTRAPGEVFVMNPSIPTNTIRPIHDDEKDVLCQLGYMVDGVSGCEVPGPWAVDDLVDTSSPVTCVSFLANDITLSNENLSVNTFDIILTQTGDTINFKDVNDCSNGNSVQALASRSFWLYLDANNLQEDRLMKYSIKNSISNRTSNEAIIINTPIDNSCQNTPENQFICNGDFEEGTFVEPVSQNYGQLLINVCPSNVIPWCNFWGSVDIFDRSLGFLNPWQGLAGPDTHNGVPNNRYLGGAGSSDHVESAFAKTKTNLSAGDYTLSFYALNRYTVGAPVDIYITDTLPISSSLISPVYTPLTNDIHLQVDLEASNFNNLDNWHQYFSNFSILNSDINYKYVLFVYHQRWLMDDVSLTRVPSQTFGKITGTTYQDLNQNGSQQTAVEPGLPGLQIGLFQSGSQTPIQTTTTEGILNQGKYTFSDLAGGTYYTALMGESNIPLITEPQTSTDPLTNYNHVHTVTVTNGQISSNNNFGIGLQGESIPGCTNPISTNYNPLATVDDGSCVYDNRTDIRIKKTLVDETLSIIDRDIVWRVTVTNLGLNNATNILVKDGMPTDFIYNGYYTPSGIFTVNSDNVGTYNIPYLAAGQSTYVDIKMKVPNSYKVCGVKTNVAQLVSLDQYDSDASNNTGQSSIKLKACKVTPISSNVKVN
jgi:uncharacterized repeat protein (TIGR01451 family)